VRRALPNIPCCIGTLPTVSRLLRKEGQVVGQNDPFRMEFTSRVL
jgi:hypothetical protein